MPYKIEFSKLALKDRAHLSKEIAKKIREAIELRLAENPKLGKPLTSTLNGLRSFRFASYRIIYKIDQERLVLSILAIEHRKNVYHTSARRLSN